MKKLQSKLESIGDDIFKPLADEEIAQAFGGGIMPEDGGGEKFCPSTTEIGQSAAFDSDRDS